MTKFFPKSYKATKLSISWTIDNAAESRRAYGRLGIKMWSQTKSRITWCQYAGKYVKANISDSHHWGPPSFSSICWLPFSWRKRQLLRRWCRCNSTTARLLIQRSVMHLTWRSSSHDEVQASDLSFLYACLNGWERESLLEKEQENRWMKEWQMREKEGRCALLRDQHHHHQVTGWTNSIIWFRQNPPPSSSEESESILKVKTAVTWVGRRLRARATRWTLFSSSKVIVTQVERAWRPRFCPLPFLTWATN